MDGHSRAPFRRSGHRQDLREGSGRLPGWSWKDRQGHPFPSPQGGFGTPGAWGKLCFRHFPTCLGSRRRHPDNEAVPTALVLQDIHPVMPAFIRPLTKKKLRGSTGLKAVIEFTSCLTVIKSQNLPEPQFSSVGKEDNRF